MKIWIALFCLVSFGITACESNGKNNDTKSSGSADASTNNAAPAQAPAPQPGSQAETDEKIIKEYVEANNLDAKRTASGIYYVIEKQGDGAKPNASQSVTVHYKGTLLDGTKFDASYDRGQPATFPLTRVIKGWTEGIPLFAVGGKGSLIIPSGLAYGPGGRPPQIPQNAVLRFDIELLDISKSAAEQLEADKKIIEEYAKANKLKGQFTPSGIYYTVEKPGSDPKPTIDNQVTVHYKGTLLDGTKFDASYDRGQPATFPLKGVVKGWQIGIPLFGKGGKGSLIIPSALAYGPSGRPPTIPQNAVLRFDIELFEIK